MHFDFIPGFTRHVRMSNWKTQDQPRWIALQREGLLLLGNHGPKRPFDSQVDPGGKEYLLGGCIGISQTSSPTADPGAAAYETAADRPVSSRVRQQRPKC